MKKLVAAALALGFGAYGSAYLCIDDFKTGPLEFELKTVGVDDNHFTMGSMLGSSRAVVGRLLANPLGKPKLSASIGDGVAVFENGPGVESIVDLIYGLDMGPGGFVYKDLNQDFSRDRLINLNFAMNESDLRLVVGLRSSSQLTGNWMYVGYTVGGGAHWSGFVHTIDLNEFAWYGFDLSDVDQIMFQFFSAPAGDYALTSIEAVPEPTLVGGLLVAASVLAVRRSRRKK